MSDGLKLILIGHGKMGRVVDEVAADAHQVLDRCTGDRPLASLAPDHGAHCGIDFSTPEAVLGTVRAAAEQGLDLAIGTTGWHGEYDTVRRAVEAAGIGVVWAANFSLGVNIFYRAVESAARILGKVEGYDPFITDWHHRFKKDAPSGTAIEIRRRMQPHYGEREIPIESLRAGYVPSVHAVGFDSTADTILLEHRARNRRGFAEGALLAARWVQGRQGFYEFQDVLDDLYPDG